jgi:hypothetical protein
LSAGVSDVLSEVPGGAALQAWFGRMPSFHDAEILELHLDRAGPSSLRVHTWDMRAETTDDGHFVLDKHVVVTFLLEEIVSLELSDFSPQNVIFGLELSKSENGFVLELEHCYGLSGRLEARRISIELQLGKPG